MHFIWGILGALIILVIASEIIVTTTQGGISPVTRFLIGFYHGLLKISRVTRFKLVRAYLGTGLTVAVIFTWIVLLWLGWTLVFCSAPQAVVTEFSGVPATFLERAYFAGFTFSTLGLGGYLPGTTGWQIVVVLCALGGFMLVTFTITFLTPLISAALFQWRLALQLYRLGSTPTSILLHAWDGDSLETLASRLDNLGTDLVQLEHFLILYPLVRFYGSREHTSTISLSVARLGEAIVMARFALDDQATRQGAFQLAYRQVSGIAEAWLQAEHKAPSTIPDLPDLSSLRKAGLPVVSDEVFAQRVAAHSTFRRALCALVTHDGQDWHDVHHGVNPL